MNELGAVVPRFLLRAIAWGYHLAPTRLRNFFGQFLGWSLFKLHFREGVVMQNLKLAYPDLTESQQVSKLHSQSYEHLGHLFLEILMLFGPFKEFVQKHVFINGYENWKTAHDQGRGVLFLSSHVGNWELMAAGGALAGMDLMLVTKHLKPEWLHQSIVRGRLSCGVSGTYEPKTFRDVLKHLKNKGTVGIVLDQYAGAPVGVRVPFFGVPVGTHTVLAALAKRTGAKIVPVVNYRLPDGRTRVDIEPAIAWEAHEDPNYELAANTARFAQILESHVRAHPDQWLWTHRRFKGDLSPLHEGEWNQGRARR